MDTWRLNRLKVIRPRRATIDEEMIEQSLMIQPAAGKVAFKIELHGFPGPELQVYDTVDGKLFRRFNRPQPAQIKAIVQYIKGGWDRISYINAIQEEEILDKMLQRPVNMKKLSESIKDEIDAPVMKQKILAKIENKIDDQVADRIIKIMGIDIDEASITGLISFRKSFMTKLHNAFIADRKAQPRELIKRVLDEVMTDDGFYHGIKMRRKIVDLHQ
jgi:hypothetical protein